MPVSLPGSKWILGCATLGLSALAATYAVAAPKNPEARAIHREQRVELVGRTILGLQMSDDLEARGNAFVPRGQRISGGNREARDSRRESRRNDAADLDLAATVRRRGGEVAPSVSPIPEPSSVILFAAGAALVLFVAKRKFA